MSSNRDFIALLIFTGVYFVAFNTPLRVPLGLLLLLFMPGYAWTVAFFPHQTTITGIERLGIAVGSSIALISLIGVVLYYLGVPFGFRPILITELAIIFSGMAVGVWRRRGEEAYRPILQGNYALIGVGLIVTIGIVMAVISVERTETFTEFYFDSVTALPREVTISDQLTVDLTIANREETAQTYRYELWVEDSWSDLAEQLHSSTPFELPPNEATTEQLIWQMPFSGDDQQTIFYLFRNDETQPYRQLTLWIDVDE